MTSFSEKYEYDSLIDREQLYKTLFEDTDEGFQILEILYDESGKPHDVIYKKVTKNAEKFSALKAEECLGKRMKEFFPTTEDYWFVEWDKVLKTGKPSHFHNYHEDSDIWFDIFSFPCSNGHVGVLFRDISNTKKVEAELNQANAELARRATDNYYKLFNSIDERIAILDIIFDANEEPVDYRFVEVNSAYMKNFRFGDPIGKTALGLNMPIDSTWMKNFAVAVKTDEPVHFNIKSNLSNQWYNLNVFKFGKESARIGVVIKNITKDIIAINELKRSLRIQEEIFANISHELKHPLSVIFTSVQMLDLFVKKNSFEVNKDKVIKYIKSMYQNCFRFTRLINNIIDINKIDQGFMKLNLSNEDIVALTENIVQSVSSYVRDKGLRIVFHSDVKEKVIACDPEKIERVMLNLLSNAIKFSNSGCEIHINISDKGEYIELSIKDAGIGMEDTSTIFDRYYQEDKTLSRNSEGSGIGLSLVKSLVEMHNGQISVQSKPGLGSTFKIQLPAIITKNPKVKKNKISNDKVEMISIEFSDIYDMLH